MLSQAIAVINGKGGVGKTSLTTNLAGLFAAAEYRVLIVDLDPQGNTARDLGFADRTDQGRALLAAVTAGSTLAPLTDVRERLDVIPGGELVEDMAGALASRTGRRAANVATAVRDVLEPLADGYDLILIDCPPGDRLLQQMALAAAHYALIPTKADDASLDGLVRVAELFAAVKNEHNPDLALLGVVLFGVGARSRRIAERAREQVARDLGDAGLVFEAEIRHVEGPAQDCRRLGLLAHEIEDKLGEATRARLALLRARRGAGAGKHRPDADSRTAAHTLAASAPALAGDYQRLAEELTGRLAGTAS